MKAGLPTTSSAGAAGGAFTVLGEEPAAEVGSSGGAWLLFDFLGTLKGGCGRDAFPGENNSKCSKL